MFNQPKLRKMKKDCPHKDNGKHTFESEKRNGRVPILLNAEGEVIFKLVRCKKCDGNAWQQPTEEEKKKL